MDESTATETIDTISNFEWLVIDFINFLGDMMPVIMICVSAVIGLLIKARFDRFQAIKQAKAEVAERENNFKYATLKQIMETITGAYLDAVSGTGIKDLRFQSLLNLYAEYKLLGGNGIADFYMDEIKRIYSQGKGG